MTTYDVEVLGDSGSPVVLIPGGAARSKGFFPHLERALTDHRVVLVDRPGTGTAHARGTASLASGSAAYAEVLEGLGAGPALVVGQSLGGAMAVQLATDHPELVSGLVLIDPTPFNHEKTMKTLGPLAKMFFGPTGWPVVGPALRRLVATRSKVADDLARQSLQQMLDDGALAWTAGALGELPAEGAALTARLHPLGVPVVLLSAERKPTNGIVGAHHALAKALGGEVVTWPGAVHSEHLREPQKVVDLVLSVLERATV